MRDHSLVPHQRVTNQNAACLSEWMLTASPSTGSCARTDPSPPETEWHRVRACHIKWSESHYRPIERLIVQKWLHTLLPMGQLRASTRPSMASRLGLGLDEKKSLLKKETDGWIPLVLTALEVDGGVGILSLFQFQCTFKKYICVVTVLLKDLG